MSESRLVAPGSHLKAVAVLLAQDAPEMGHAIAALARVALESTARVAWLLDPAIDGRVRGLRGLAELMNTFSEEAKIPVPLFRDKGKALFDELVEGAQALGRAPNVGGSGSVQALLRWRYRSART